MRIKILTLLSIFIPGFSHAERDQEMDKYFSMPIVVQIEEMSRLSPMDKLRIYFYGNEEIHPPATYLSGSVAISAVEVIPIIKDILREETNDLIIRDIVALMVDIKNHKYYNIESDKELIYLLDGAVSRVSEPWVGVVRKIYSTIR